LWLLAEGHALEEVASRRAVTINTARSQLKQVFAKTDTRRQGELVRLVLTGVASLGDDRER
jgi:DNA-binding CsgD family transcriptional regulator